MVGLPFLAILSGAITLWVEYDGVVGLPLSGYVGMDCLIRGCNGLRVWLLRIKCELLSMGVRLGMFCLIMCCSVLAGVVVVLIGLLGLSNGLNVLCFIVNEGRGPDMSAWCPVYANGPLAYVKCHTVVLVGGAIFVGHGLLCWLCPGYCCWGWLIVMV